VVLGCSATAEAVAYEWSRPLKRPEEGGSDVEIGYDTCPVWPDEPSGKVGCGTLV